jgi:hypothetical protein
MAKVKEKQEVKQKIMPTLKSMELYRTVEFPKNRLTVVGATIQKVKVELGKDFSYRTNKETGMIEVTRIG